MALLLSLAACGGGDDGPPPVISGTAMKGVLKNALVTASELKAGGAPVAIGSACTGNDGAFSVTYSGYTGGPILLKVQPVANPSGCKGNNLPTTTVCDVAAGCGTGIDFGDTFTVTPASGISLHALVENAAPVAMITPFTELAARNAMRLAGNPGDLDTVDLSALSAADLLRIKATAREAREQLENLPALAGINLLTTVPPDITKPFPTGSAAQNDAATYAALCAGVLGAYIGDGGSTADPGAAIDAAVDKLVASFGDGGIPNNDSVSGNDATTTSLAELIAAARTAAAGSEVPGYDDSSLDSQDSAIAGNPGGSSNPASDSKLTWNQGSWNLGLWN